MYILFQLIQLMKRNLYFFIPIQIMICIIIIFLAVNTESISYILFIPYMKANDILEIMVLLLHFISLLLSLYITIGEELNPFCSFIFTRNKKTNFVLNKNIVILCYSTIIGTFIYIEYASILKHLFDYILNIKFILIYIVFLYVLYLTAYSITLLFKSNQIAIIVQIILLIFVVLNKINIIKLVCNPIILLFTIIIINIFIIIQINIFDKPLKKGSD